MLMRTRSLITTLALTAAAGAAQAQNIKIVNIVELSGPGTTSGTMFNNGALMAAKEINEAGGILGKKIDMTSFDTQSNPGIAKGLVQRAIDDGAFSVFGPVFSGSVMVSMTETRRAEVPNITGGEAAAITKQGNPYIFRTSFTQDNAMPRVAKYIANTLKAKTAAVLFVNNDFGKGGRDAINKAFADLGIKVVADVSTESGQLDFSAPVLRIKQANPDVAFLYTNEEESARLLREMRKQGWTKPMVGETTLTGQKVIELAGDSSNGAIAHVGLTVDAPNPLVLKFKAKYYQAYKSISDHNGIKGYTGLYMVKAAIEKVGKFDRVAVAKAMHGMKFPASKYPGVLMDVAIDNNGDLDRESYIVEVKNGQQVVKETLPPLNPIK